MEWNLVLLDLLLQSPWEACTLWILLMSLEIWLVYQLAHASNVMLY